MTRKKTTFPGAVLYVRHFPANVPGPIVCPPGGRPFVPPAQPWVRHAFYASPEAQTCIAWDDGRVRKDRKTYTLNGVCYALRHQTPAEVSQRLQDAWGKKALSLMPPAYCVDQGVWANLHMLQGQGVTVEGALALLPRMLPRLVRNAQ